MPLLSVVIISYHAQDQIVRCIASAKTLADEIVVVDSGSTDQTVANARALGAHVISQPWQGFGPQKRFAVAAARNDWVLCLDTDEQLTTALQHAIAQAMQAPQYQAYQFARCNRFLGRYLRHGEGYPDKGIRLFNRQYAQWSADPVHEIVRTKVPVGTLDGDLLHDSAESVSAYLVKQNHYTDLQAQMLWRQGKKISVARLLLSPLLRFVKFYLVKQGFRDGLPGLIHIVLGCVNTFNKYVKWIELSVRNKQE